MWVGRHIDSSHTLILSFRNTGGVVSVFVSDGLFNVIKRRALPKDGTTVNGLSVIICYLSAYGYWIPLLCISSRIKKNRIKRRINLGIKGVFIILSVNCVFNVYLFHFSPLPILWTVSGLYVTWFLEPDTALFFKIIIIIRSVILYEQVEDNIAISLKTFFQSFQWNPCLWEIKINHLETVALVGGILTNP